MEPGPCDLVSTTWPLSARRRPASNLRGLAARFELLYEVFNFQFLFFEGTDFDFVWGNLGILGFNFPIQQVMTIKQFGNLSLYAHSLPPRQISIGHLSTDTNSRQGIRGKAC
jgi:hypothetical protein